MSRPSLALRRAIPIQPDNRKGRFDAAAVGNSVASAEEPVAFEAVIEAEAPAVKQTAESIVVGRLFCGDKPPTDFDLEDLPTLTADNKNLAWVDLEQYSERDLDHVSKLLGLHQLSVEAALDSWQRPRLDSFPDHFYVSTTVATVDSSALQISAGELGIWVGRNFLVSAHRKPLPFIEAVLDRLKQSPELAQLHTAFVLYILLDELVNHYALLFENLENKIEETEERALRETSDAFLSELLHLKRYVFALGRLADQHHAVFAAFTRPDFTFVSGPDIEPYFKDLQEGLDRVADRLLAARDAVNGAFDIYVSHMAHRTNGLIKILTLVSTVLLPATLVIAIAQVMFRLPILSSLPEFLITLGAVILIPGTLIAIVVRRKLL